MTLQETTEGQQTSSHRDLVLVLLAAAIVLMVVATALLGMQHTGPLYDIAPDPAHLSGLPF